MATAVASGLVAAYADLRQLQFLLQSLLDALLAQVPPTAAAVLCVPPLVQALQKVSLCISKQWLKVVSRLVGVSATVQVRLGCALVPALVCSG